MSFQFLTATFTILTPEALPLEDGPSGMPSLLDLLQDLEPAAIGLREDHEWQDGTCQIQLYGTFAVADEAAAQRLLAAAQELEVRGAQLDRVDLEPILPGQVRDQGLEPLLARVTARSAAPMALHP